MKEIKQYVAVDGTIFNTEEECLKHEHEVKTTKASILFEHKSIDMEFTIYRNIEDDIMLEYTLYSPDGVDILSYLNDYLHLAVSRIGGLRIYYIIKVMALQEGEWVYAKQLEEKKTL